MSDHNLLANEEAMPQTGTSSAIRGPIVKFEYFACVVGNRCAAVSKCEFEPSVSQVSIDSDRNPWHVR
ncbi:hypothetical protein [Caballeronia sp. BCC1704]|uniref:hypothetical protein n=1 Tax=Caballeronia sp. BCC1704 TaxID=2676300 RepID=UPI001FC816A2|nr:hypothetical protein [Caballeronia sp. BCC1704]